MGVNPVVIAIWTAITLSGHLLLSSYWVRKHFHFNIRHAFLPLTICGGIALAISILGEINHIKGYEYVFSSTTLLLINALASYFILCYFLLVFATFLRFILTQKRKKAYQTWHIFSPLLMLYAFLQAQIAFFPIAVYLLWAIGGLIWLPLLLQLRWVAVLDTPNKWLTLLYISIINLFSVLFIIKLSITQLPYIIIEPRIANLFMLMLITSVVSYGFMSWLALVFGMPVASFVAEQRAEIASFQTLNKLVQNKVSRNELLEHLFDTCLKNTDSDAGWLIVYNNKKEENLKTSNLSSEQIGFLNIKSKFKEIVHRENANAIKLKKENENAETYLNSTKTGEIFIAPQAVGDVYYFPYLVQQSTYNDDDGFVKSLLILPVRSSVTEQLLGVVCLCKSFSDGYNEYMMELAKSYVAQTQLSIEHLELVSETVKTVRYKREWEIASRVQQALMPKQFPDNPYCEIAGFAESAVEVGGDYYDYARPNNNSIALIMGDVSGKGASAAFHMAQMKGIFQSLMQFALDAHTFMQHANHAVARCLDRKQYITIAYLLLDFDSKSATYSRAGHCPMLYYSSKNDHVTLMMGQGTGLGVIRNESFSDFIESQQFDLHSNDILLLYTDGLVEGRLKGSDEQYGYERLKKCLLENQGLDAESIVNKLYADYKLFTYGSDFKDDTSLLLVKIK